MAEMAFYFDSSHAMFEKDRSCSNWHGLVFCVKFFGIILRYTSESSSKYIIGKVNREDFSTWQSAIQMPMSWSNFFATGKKLFSLAHSFMNGYYYIWYFGFKKYPIPVVTIGSHFRHVKKNNVHSLLLNPQLDHETSKATWWH